MSETDADQQEPSMEEILASIRRIISEDGEDGEEEAVETEEEAVVEPEPVEAAAEEGRAEDEDDGVLVLTDMVEESEEAEVAEDVADDEELVLEEVEPEAEPEPEPEPEAEPEPAAVDEDDALLSFEAEEQSAAAISGLVSAIGAGASVGGGEKTLEQLTKELLRPLLKEWLDENLPGTVDRIVREEIERVVAKSK